MSATLVLRGVDLPACTPRLVLPVRFLGVDCRSHFPCAGIFYVMLENNDSEASGDWALRQAFLLLLIDFFQVSSAIPRFR